MYEHADIQLIDDEGILICSYTEESFFLYDGEPEDLESPLMLALTQFYAKNAKPTLLCLGYDTPSGDLFWESEFATPYEGDHKTPRIEIGERLYLVTRDGERVYDELAYRALSEGTVPQGWSLIPR